MENISNNTGRDNTTANSYIPIDLTNCVGKYNLKINTSISSQRNYDYGYVTITETPEAPSYTTTNGRIVYTSDTAEDVTTVTTLQAGKMYYLHFGYRKDATISEGNDKFIINSVELSLSDLEIYDDIFTTNENGQIITEIPFGKYELIERKAADGYWINEEPIIIEFREDGEHEFTIYNERKANVIVHHYIKDTTISIADDENIEGKVGEEYKTQPVFGLARYELEKDANGEYVIPINATGEFTKEDKEVIYYYVEKEIPLTVHHYIDGTNEKVPLKDGTIAEDEFYTGESGTTYSTQYKSDELDSAYELSEVPYNAEGIYENDAIEVIYYYKRLKEI